MANWLERLVKKGSFFLGPAVILGRPKEGGVDLVIVYGESQNVSAKARRILKERIECYLQAIKSHEFQLLYGFPPAEKTRVVVVCFTQPHQRIGEWIEEWKPWVADNSARLELVVGMDGLTKRCT